MKVPSLFSAITLTFSMSACVAGSAGSDGPTESDDSVSTEQAYIEMSEEAALGTDNTSDLAQVSSYFLAASKRAASADGEPSQAAAVAEASEELQAAVGNIECLSIETDRATFVDATFDNCLLAAGYLLVDGSLHGEIAIDGDDIVASMNTDGLQLNQTSIAGSWQASQPLDGGALDWQGQLDIVGPNGGALSYSSSASVLIEGSCVSLSAQAERTGPRRSYSMEVTGYERCRAQCPSAGEVSIANARGDNLSWSYAGDGTADVTSPRGGQFSIQLPCAY